MMDFPALIQGLFFLFMIALTIMTIVFFRKPATQRSFSQDTRALLLLLSIGIILIATALMSFKLMDWSKQYRKDKEEFHLQQELNLDEYAFVDQTFLPLGQEYRLLKANLEGLEKLIGKIRTLKRSHQNHQPLLRTMLETFNAEKKTQSELYKKVNLEIRNAMLQSATTQNTISVQSQFYDRAKVLHGEITKAQKQVDKKLGDTAGLLAENLKEARKVLVPPNKKKDEKWRIYSFQDATAQPLLQLLAEEDKELSEMVNKIRMEVITARQNKDTMQVLSQRENDLKEPLSKTMKLWEAAEMQGHQYWGNLLYALEAMYLSRQFNMPKHNPAYRLLMRDVKATIPVNLNRLQATRREVESSFISPDYVDKKAK